MMSNLYKRYFGNNDVSDGKAKLMYDIYENRLSVNELEDIIIAMSSKGMLIEKPFKERPKEAWNDKYSYELSTGFIADYFSESYLRYFAEVSAYLHKKKRQKKIIILAMAALICIAIIIIMLYSNLMRKEAELTWRILEQIFLTNMSYYLT